MIDTSSGGLTRVRRNADDDGGTERRRSERITEARASIQGPKILLSVPNGRKDLSTLLSLGSTEVGFGVE